MNVQLDNSACKKKAVLKSTLELIKEHGFHGTAMSHIAKNACVAAGTIYHYFDSKDSLITELYVYVKDQLAEALLACDDTQKSYKERFLNFWICQCNYYIENESSLIFLEQYINSPYIKLYPEKDSKLFRNKVASFFIYGIDAGYLKKVDYELLGPVIRGSIVAAARYHLSGRYDFTEERLKEMALIVWDGIKMPDK